MTKQKITQTTKAYVRFRNIFLTLIVVMLLADITEADKIRSEEHASLWTYNNKKEDKTMDKQSLQDTIAEIQNTIDNLQNQLIPLLKQCESFNEADPKFQETVKSLGDECATRQKRLDELEKQITNLEAAFESKSKKGLDDNQSIEKLQNKLIEVEKEHDRLKEQESKLLEDTVKYKEQQGRGVNKPAPDMNPVFAMLYNNRIVPIKEPYYKIESVLQVYNGQMVSLTQVERVKDGEPINDAVKPGGCFDSLLSEIDPAKEYAVFLVCPDSVSAFRVAAKKAKERGIRYAWKPGEDTTLYGGSGKPNHWPD